MRIPNIFCESVSNLQWLEHKVNRGIDEEYKTMKEKQEQIVVIIVAFFKNDFSIGKYGCVI